MDAWRVVSLVFTPSLYILLASACLAQFKIIFNFLSTAVYHMQRSPLEPFAPSEFPLVSPPFARAAGDTCSWLTLMLTAACLCFCLRFRVSARTVLKTFVQYLESIFG